MTPDGSGLSVIIPTLNEERAVATCLVTILETLPNAEILIVDGKSTDGTRNVAQVGGLVLTSKRGRPFQMNAGAEFASGKVLWFVYANTTIPEDAGLRMAEALVNPEVVGGCFRLRFPKDEWIYRLNHAVANRAARWNWLALGQQGIFCRKETFEALGGFPETPLFEDADFYRAACGVGRMLQIDAEITATTRRFEKHGPWRVTLAHLLLLMLYLLRVPNETLFRLSKRFFPEP